MRRILFTTIYNPDPILGRWAATDQMGYRLTRGQGIFTLSDHAHAWALHLLAQNIQCESVVLEWPSLEELETECSHGSFDFVCITIMNRDINKLRTMTGVIRHHCPQAKIVIGGYGVICLQDDKQDEILPACDYICREEGVHFLRRLLEEDANQPISCYLPQTGAFLPWLVKHGRGSVGSLLSGLGCTQRCPFCVTSYYTKGRFIPVLDEPGIYEGMKRYWKINPFTSTVNIYDENFLDHKDRADTLGRFIRDDETYGLQQLNYFTFASISAISKYEPEELLLNGLDSVWIGVESAYTRLKKRQGLKITDVFHTLHSIGIKTTGSFILGLDEQDPGNIEADEDFFVSLNPTFQQVSILTVEPAMAISRAYRKKSREKYPWENYHMYGQTYEPRNFTFGQLLKRVNALYKRLYHTNGPSITRMLESNLQGYRFCKNSKNALLCGPKAAFFKQRVENYTAMLGPCIEFAPNHAVRQHLKDLEQEILDTFGPLTESQVFFREHLLKKAAQEFQSRGEEDRPIMKDNSRRYTYHAKRPTIAKPYSVIYQGQN